MATASTWNKPDDPFADHVPTVYPEGDYPLVHPDVTHNAPAETDWFDLGTSYGNAMQVRWTLTGDPADRDPRGKVHCYTQKRGDRYAHLEVPYSLFLFVLGGEAQGEPDSRGKRYRHHVWGLYDYEKE